MICLFFCLFFLCGLVDFGLSIDVSSHYRHLVLAQVGGVPGVLKYLLEKGLIDGSCLTGPSPPIIDCSPMDLLSK